jgi:hypothetical protein
LADARQQREETRKLLANGTDLGVARKTRKLAQQERAANSFETVAREWFEKWEAGVTVSTAKAQRERLAKHIVPARGQTPVADINAPKGLGTH